MLPATLCLMLASVAVAAPNNKPPGVCKRGIYGQLSPLEHYRPAQEYCIKEFGYQKVVTVTADSRKHFARGTMTTPAAPSTTPRAPSTTPAAPSTTPRAPSTTPAAPSSTTSSLTTSSSTTASSTTASSTTPSTTPLATTSTQKATTTTKCTKTTAKCEPGECYGKPYECMLSSAKCQKKEAAKTLCSCIVPPKTVTVPCKPTKA